MKKWNEPKIADLGVEMTAVKPGAPTCGTCGHELKPDNINASHTGWCEEGSLAPPIRS